MSKTESSGTTTTYQCKKCRRVVLLEEQVMNHTPGEADQEFDAMFPNMIGDVHNKNPGGEDTQCTSSIFVEPMSWMNGGTFIYMLLIMTRVLVS